MQEWQRGVGKEWAKLSEEEKSPYFEKYKKAMEEYRHELQIWEEKMIRLGNIDIVRNEALMEPKVRSLQRTRKPKKTEEQGFECLGPDTPTQFCDVPAKVMNSDQKTEELMGRDTISRTPDVIHTTSEKPEECSTRVVSNAKNIRESIDNMKSGINAAVKDGVIKADVPVIVKMEEVPDHHTKGKAQSTTCEEKYVNKLSQEWMNLKSKFPKGYDKHVMLVTALVVCAACFIRLMT